MQVLDHDDDRVAPLGRVDQPADHVAEGPLPRLGAQRRQPGGRDRGRRGSRRAAAGSSASSGSSSRERPATRSRAIRSGVGVADPEVIAHQLQHRHEGNRLAVRLGLRFEDLDSLARGSVRRIRGRGGSCRRRGRRPAATTPPSPASARSKRLLEGRHLVAAPDEAGEAALAGEVEPRARPADSGQLEDPDRPAGALDLELAEVLELEVAGGELRGFLGEVGLARLGQRLHPLREPDRVADRGVVALRGARPERPGDDLAGVDPDPDREVEALRAAQLGRVLADVVEHLQRRVTGPPAVVLVGDRRPEDGHDPVAGELVDGPLEALDGVGEDREEALHDLAPLLGVVLLGEVHRPLHVGEQHGHLLALGVVLAYLRDHLD